MTDRGVIDCSVTDRRVPSILPPAMLLLLAAALLALVAASAPFSSAAFSSVLFGPLHVLLAVRYLSGRIAGAVPASIVAVLAVSVLVMALIRAVTVIAPDTGRALELAGSVALVSFACVLGLRGRLRLLALLPVACIAAVVLLPLSDGWYLFVHAHNVVPLIFLWDWARRRSPGPRLAFVALNLLWMLSVPAAILLGAIDPLLGALPESTALGAVDPHALMAGLAPHGAGHELGMRMTAVFAFLQLMHYVLWMVFFQVWGRGEVVRVPALVGRRFWMLAAAVTAVLWAVYAIGYDEGRAVYGVLGAFNLYLEQPIAVWLLLAALPASAVSPLVNRLRAVPASEAAAASGSDSACGAVLGAGDASATPPR